ncbi:MAG: polymer-forming cytoskeletal protein [Vicinamibacterales bacterium]
MTGKRLVVAYVMAPAMALLTALALPASLRAQTDVTAVRDQVRARFDVVPLTSGVGLVPKAVIAGVRLIEVRDGAVTINGEAATAKDVRTKLGTDADLVLRVTYLDAAGLAALTGAPGGAGVVPVPPAPPSPPDDPGTPDARESRRERRRQSQDDGKRDGKREGQRDGIVRFGGSVTIEKDDHVSGEVVVMGGTARILGTVEDELVVIGGTADVQGTIEGDVSVVGGTLTLGPQSVVEGDVSVAGGSVQREAGSRVDGKIEEVGVGGGKGSATIFPGDMHRMRPSWGMFARVGSFFGQVWRGTLLLLFALAAVALGGRYVRPMAARVAVEPARSGGVGLLAEVLFVPVLVITIVVLAVSIVGIPFLLLLPFALVLLLIVALLGFTGVALQLGRGVAGRFGITSDSPYMLTTVGVVSIVALTLVARALAMLGGGFFGGFLGGLLGFLGFLVEYVAWTVGFGAALWVLRRSRGRTPVETPQAPQPMAPEVMV